MSVAMHFQGSVSGPSNKFFPLHKHPYGVFASMVSTDTWISLINGIFFRIIKLRGHWHLWTVLIFFNLNRPNHYSKLCNLIKTSYSTTVNIIFSCPSTLLTIKRQQIIIKKSTKNSKKKARGTPSVFPPIFLARYFKKWSFPFWRLDLIEENQQKLKPMSVGHFGDFKRTGRGDSSRLDVQGKGVTYNALLREGRLRISDHN